MKTKNVKIEENLHRRVKVLSAKRGLEIGALCNEVILSYLEKAKA